MIVDERSDASVIPRNVKRHFCGKCLIEMVRVEKRDSFCSICGRHIENAIYKCPDCGMVKKVFEQDYDSQSCCF